MINHKFKIIEFTYIFVFEWVVISNTNICGVEGIMHEKLVRGNKFQRPSSCNKVRTIWNYGLHRGPDSGNSGILLREVVTCVWSTAELQT